MKKLKSKIILLTVLCFLLWQNAFTQSQETYKLMYWNGENLEMVYATIDMNNGDLKELHYQATTQSTQVKLDLEKKASQTDYISTWIATNPSTNESFEVSSSMTIIFSYPDGQEKEFLYAMEYINGDEKIMMGSMPILGDIIYQKRNNTPELWLKDADLNCKDGERNGKLAFLCNFITTQGDDLQLMIDQNGNQVTLWRDGEVLNFTSKK